MRMTVPRFWCAADHTWTSTGSTKIQSAPPDMERTVNMVSLNASTVHRHRVLRWAAVVCGMASAFATGLLTAKSFSLAAERPHAAINAVVNQPVAAAAPATSEIVPSPVIGAQPQFFFGTGDGNGYWADRPKP